MGNAVKITIVVVAACALLVAARWFGVGGALQGLLQWIASFGVIAERRYSTGVS